MIQRIIQRAEISRGKEFTDIFVSSVPSCNGELEDQTRFMLGQLVEKDCAQYLQFERIFVKNSADIATIHRMRHKFYHGLLQVQVPPASYIVAPHASGALVSTIAMGVKPGFGQRPLESRTIGGEFYNRGRIVTYDGFEHLYLGNIAGVQNGQIVEGLVPQLKQALLCAEGLMRHNGFSPLEHLVRTWFSITDVNEQRPDGRTPYLDFNEYVRTPWLERIGFEGQYFASTGTGNGKNKDGRHAEIAAIAYKPTGVVPIGATVSLIPMDNHLQTAVYRYMQDEKPDPEKNKVCFERGFQVITPHTVLYFISGTASIRENKEVGDTLEEQTHKTIHNIMTVLNSYGGSLADTMMAVTYVKPGEDVSVVEDIMNRYLIGPKQMPHLIVIAEMCYRPLLMETELIAAMPLTEYNRRISRIA